MATRIWQSADNTTNKTTIDIPAGILSADTQYEFRARHKGAVTGYSDWTSKIVRTLASFGYNQLSKLVASDGAANDNFGNYVSISADGTTALVGAQSDDTKGSVYVFKYDGTSWSQTKLVASDGAANDLFGYSVSISADGTIALVGAQSDDDKGTNSGSVYVFKYNGTSWSQQTKLVASDGAANDFFGYSVSISADGTKALVGAYYDDTKGSVYVFKYDGTSWSQQTKLVASDGAASDWFGYSVSISADGTKALVGAQNDDTKGSVYVFKYDGTSWSQTKLVASDGAASDLFGNYVSISADGTIALVGAPTDDDKGTNSGSVYVFKYDGTSWSQQTKLVASDGAAGDYFGRSVSISADGTIALVGAPNDDTKGSVYVFKYDGTSWSQQTKLIASDGAASDSFGHSVSISADGTTALIGAPNDDDKGTNSGSVYVFKG